MIVSPSLWWDNESLLKAAPALLAKQPGDRQQVYISVGTEGKQMEDDAKRLVQVFKESGKDAIQVHFAFLPEEDHATILHNSIYKGFLMMREPQAG